LVFQNVWCGVESGLRIARGAAAAEERSVQVPFCQQNALLGRQASLFNGVCLPGVSG